MGHFFKGSIKGQNVQKIRFLTLFCTRPSKVIFLKVNLLGRLKEYRKGKICSVITRACRNGIYNFFPENVTGNVFKLAKTVMVANQNAETVYVSKWS